MIAQTTQFTEPGWRHVNGANGLLPNDGKFDTYNTYEAPNRSAWSLVAETSAATAAEPETFHVTGGLPARVVHVWATNLRGPGQFMNLGDVRPHDGTFSAVLQPGYVYTFTTTTGQSRAGGHPAAAPASGPAPLPYTAAEDAAGMARLLAPVGSFGYVHGTHDPDHRGKAGRMALPRPGHLAVRGRRRQHLERLHRLGPRGAAAIRDGVRAARRRADRPVPGHRRGPGQPVSRLRIEAGQQRRLAAHGQRLGHGDARVRESGGQPYTYNLSLTTQGATISARINGARVASVTSRTYQNGPAGLASLGYYPVQYFRFRVG